ncbi:MAG: phytase [Carboxylicivirga sp.]|nr:phytase [Carboxylicivirga sp.]
MIKTLKYSTCILCISSLFSCQLKQSNNIENKEFTLQDSIIAERNKEAREDSLKMADALRLQAKITHRINADYETPPVSSEAGEDAADDPAIWVNKNNPEKSLIIGTNKTAGLHIYDLKGRELQFIAAGEINNADVGYDFQFNNQKMDIVGGTNRTKNSVDIWQLDSDQLRLKEQPLISIPSSVDDVYGFCFYHDTKADKHYAYVNGKNGNIEQWWLNNKTKDMKAELVRSFWVKSQPEGMVVDPVTNTLFVGVEEDAIYKFSALESADTTSIKIKDSDINNPAISYDIEGLSVYRISETEGYLIASIQGSFSYAVFDLCNQNNYITSFKITNGIVDGVEETDGLDVTNVALSPEFPNGILVVQDGFNKDGDQDVNQNFKIISFEKILMLLK